MSRKYLAEMIEEIEFMNYQRYLQASGTVSTPGFPEFHNLSYLNRCDWVSRGCCSPHWLFPNLSKSNCESFEFLKRSEQFGFYKNIHGGKPTWRENDPHQGRWIPGKMDRLNGGDFCQSGKRYFMNWSRVPSLSRSKPHFDANRFQKRIPGCSRNYPEKPMNHLQRYKDERLEPLDNFKGITKYGSIKNLYEFKHNLQVVPNEVTNKTALVKTSSSNNLNVELTQRSALTPSPEKNNEYTSWYHVEEQQQIVNMLKEVNMRHERQLRRDSASRSDRPFSDDSVCSNADKTSFSSDEEDDGIVVLVSPEVDGLSPDVPDAEEEKELTNDYLEKSGSDYFEEFQGIFTVSPEKILINSLTKEFLKESAKSNEKTEVIEEVILNDEKESLDQNKSAEDMENKKTNVSVSAVAESESGIRDIKATMKESAKSNKTEAAEEAVLNDAEESLGKNKSADDIENKKAHDSLSAVTETKSGIRDVKATMKESDKSTQKREATEEADLNNEEESLGQNKSAGDLENKKADDPSSALVETESGISDVKTTEEAILNNERESLYQNKPLDDIEKKKADDPSSAVVETESGILDVRTAEEAILNNEKESFYQNKPLDDIENKKADDPSSAVVETVSSILDVRTTEEAILNNEKESFYQNKPLDDIENKKADDSVTAAANPGSGVLDVKGDTWNWIIPESDQRETETLLAGTEDTQISTSNESKISFDAPPFVPKYSQIQNDYEISDSIKNTGSFSYEMNGKRREDLQTNKAVFPNSVQKNKKPENVCDRCSSRSNLIKMVSQLHKKNMASPLKMKPQSLNNNHSHSFHHQPKTLFSFPNQTIVYIPNSLPIDYRVKRNPTNSEFKTYRQPQCSSGAKGEPVETVFINNFSSLFRQNIIPEKKETKSEPYLLRKNVTNTVPITSFSESHLPFKSGEMHYKRISVEELFQTVSQNGKTRNFPEFTTRQGFVFDSKSDHLTAASDHLKKILKIGKENESLVQSSRLENNYKTKGSSKEVRNYGNTESVSTCTHFIDPSLLSRRYAPDGGSCNRVQNQKTRVDYGKLTTSIADHTATRNNSHHSIMKSQTKHEMACENCKHGEFTQFNQKDDIDSLLACSQTKPSNKTKSENLDPIIYKIYNVESLPKKSSGQESLDQKVTVTKSKWRKKVKNGKTKAINADVTESKPASDNNAYNGKMDFKQELKIRPDHHEKLDRMVPIKNPTSIEDGKSRNSWKDRKHVDASTFSRKDSNKDFECDRNLPKTVKTTFHQQESESNVKETRQSKAKGVNSRKHDSGFSKNRDLPAVNKESLTDLSPAHKNKKFRGIKNNGEVMKALEKVNSNVGDFYSLKTDEDDRNYPAENKHWKMRENYYSKSDLPPNWNKFPNKVRQNCSPRNVLNSRNFSGREYFERDQTLKTQRNCDRLVKNCAEDSEAASCAGKRNYNHANNSFHVHKNSSKTRNKNVPFTETNMKEKFISESVHCSFKHSDIDDKKCGVSEMNVTCVKTEEKQKHSNNKIGNVNSKSKQNKIPYKLEDDAKPVARNAEETKQSLNNLLCKNITKNANFTASDISQNITGEEINCTQDSDYAPIKEGEVCGDNQMCCFHTVDEDIQRLLHSVLKINNLDQSVEKSGTQFLCNKNASSSTNNHSENLIHSKTECKRENNETEVVCESTYEDSCSRNKKNSEHVEAPGLKSKNNNVESLTGNEGKSSTIRQPSCFSFEEIQSENESVPEQKMIPCVELNHFIPEHSVSTFDHLNEMKLNLQNYIGNQIFKNTFKGEDFFLKNKKSEKSLKSANKKQDTNSKVTSDILGLSEPISKTIHTPIGSLPSKVKLEKNSSVKKEFHTSNSITREQSELLHYIISLNRDVAIVPTERNKKVKAKIGEFPNATLQLNTFKEGTVSETQVSSVQAICNGCNSKSESLRNCKENKNERESDLKKEANPEKFILLLGDTEVPKPLNNDDNSFGNIKNIFSLT